MQDEMVQAESQETNEDVTLEVETQATPEAQAEPQEDTQGNTESEVDSESSPDIATEQEKTRYTAGVKKTINKMHREKMEFKEELAEERKVTAALKAKYEVQDTEISEVPSLPDQFDDDYEPRRLEREKVLVENARRSALAEHKQELALQAQQAAQIKQQNEWSEKQAAFMAAGLKAELSEDSIVESAQTISNLGMPPEAIAMLVGESDGAVIMDYLAKNPDLTIEIAAMNPYQQGAAIQSKVRNAAKPKAKKMTKAPAPPKTANGAAGHHSGDHLLKGATFE